jgi:hypothetical protein
VRGSKSLGSCPGKFVSIVGPGKDRRLVRAGRPFNDPVDSAQIDRYRGGRQEVDEQRSVLSSELATQQIEFIASVDSLLIKTVVAVRSAIGSGKYAVITRDQIPISAPADMG